MGSKQKAEISRSFSLHKEELNYQHILNEFWKRLDSKDRFGRENEVAQNYKNDQNIRILASLLALEEILEARSHEKIL